MTDMLQQSESLIINGFSIFPIVYKDKIPLTEHGFKDASMSFEQLKKWDKEFKEYNIAIKTGNGICVIDIDAKSGGSESWLELLEHNELPDTVCANTGGGGKHFFFKGDIKNTANKLGKGIDTRGEGGYVVSPPSIHPSGKAYEWAFEHSPDEIEIAELPDWLNPNLVQIKPDTFKTEDYLPKDHTLPAEAGNRNSSLASLAGELVNDGDNYNKVMKLCIMWNRGNKDQLSIKEIETTVKSIFRTHSNNHPAVISETFEKHIEQDEELPNLTEDLIDVGGVIGMMCDEMNANAYMKQPILTFGAVTTFFSTVIGKFYKLRCDTRSNLYTIGIADSGAGKQDVITNIEIIANQSGLDHLIDAEDVTSGQAILSALEERQLKAVYFPFDEVGEMIASFSGKNSSTHEREKGRVFTTLYTSANKIYRGKRFASKKRIEIEEPLVSYYGTGNPSDFFDAITPKLIKSGFFGRQWILFPLDNDPEPNHDKERFQPSEKLINALKQWANKMPSNPEYSDLENALCPKPQIVDLSPGAKKVFIQYDNLFREKKRQYIGSRNLHNLWVRPLSIAKKLSLDFTVSLAMTPRGMENVKPKVHELTAEKACLIALISYERLCMECERNLTDSIGEAVQKDVLACIRRKGRHGATKTDFARSLRKWETKQITEAISMLSTGKFIFTEEHIANNKLNVITFFIVKETEKITNSPTPTF